jgi:hypothetical protein
LILQALPLSNGDGTCKIVLLCPKRASNPKTETSGILNPALDAGIEALARNFSAGPSLTANPRRVPPNGFRSTSCRQIWIPGSRNTMRRGHIRDVGVSEKLRMQTFLDAIPMTKEKMIAA